jgi:integrase
MRRLKKNLKAKEPVTIRFKQLSNGNQSIYLDLYKDGVRRYEFLKLYLIPEPRGDARAKEQNANTMQVAIAIKAQRIKDIANNQAGITLPKGGKMLLMDWAERIAEQKQKNGQSGKRASTCKCANKKLAEYVNGRKIRLQDIDKSFVLGYIEFLKDAHNDRAGGTLSAASARLYFTVFSNAMKIAVCDGLIYANPVDRITAEERKQLGKRSNARAFLTIEEVKSIQDVKMKNGFETKMAFLFSCFTGLRYSDIASLRWEDIQPWNDGFAISKEMVKTRQNVFIPISKVAMRWMPERGTKQSEDLVFTLPCIQWLEKCVKEMAAKAGITKHISFHTARHTFATMQLTLGGDIYTVSKLLGHSNVKTTQVYAEVVNQKKQEAINLFDGIF